MKVSFGGALAVAVATTGAAGCSWMMVESPPRTLAAGQPPRCTQSRMAPWIDTYVTGAFALTAAGVLAQDAGGLEKVLAVVVVLPAIPFGISAIWGHTTVGECRRLNSLEFAAEPGDGPSRSTGSPPPAGPSPPAEPPPPAHGAVRRICRDREDFDRTRDCVMPAAPAGAAVGK